MKLLRSLLRLKGCNIRLGRKKDFDLRPLANNYVFQGRTLLYVVNKNFDTSWLCVELDLVEDFDQILDKHDTDMALEIELFSLLDFHIDLRVSFDLETVLGENIMGLDYNNRNANVYSKVFNSVEYNGVSGERFCGIPPWHKSLKGD
ncbi:unnamed protein product, partial [Clonostachys solani]